jgi:flagellar hook assembly protein FlgD
MQIKLSSDDFVKIEVFDLYGRKIKELYSGHQQAGEQNVTWNGNDSRGSGVEAGIYMIRIRTGLLSTSQRVIKIN